MPVARGSGWLDPALAQLAGTHPDQQVQVIVQQAGAGTAEAAVAGSGGTVVARFPIINGFAAKVTARQAAMLAGRADVRVVSLDRAVATAAATRLVEDSFLATSYVDAVMANKAWNGSAQDIGTGVGVAVLDTGVAANPDLGARLVAAVKTNPKASGAGDTYGHGTHVAGIIAGRSADGKYIGIAPGANIISVKVADDAGSATETDMIAGLQWVYDSRTTYNIRVVNISASVIGQLSYNTDPLDAAVEKLWFAGVTVVVAAGNEGSSACSTCHAPANDPYVITVGAIDDHGTKDLLDDTMPSWSSIGQTQDGFRKPEIVAPGAHIVSTIPAGSMLATRYPQNVVDGRYFKMGGTSMAAPMVSGTIALLLEKNPQLTPNQIKWLLMNTGRSYNGMTVGGPKAVDATAAVKFTGTLGTANGGQTMSGGTAGTQGSTTSNIYWLVSLDY